MLHKTRFLLLLVALLTLSALASCQLFDKGEGGEDSASEAISDTVETVEEKPVYTADTETFHSFADLKENAALFADQLPCTRSTLGYHKKDDGGAGTYLLTADKPEGTFEKVANGVWAQLVVENVESISVKQLGARGNGKGDDSLAIIRAINRAVEAKVILTLPEGDYRTTQPITFDGINVISENAKISFYGLQGSTAAVYVGSNTAINGTLNIWFVDNTPTVNHGERCGMSFGKYVSGEGAYNSYVEHVVITGGYENCNAMLITGDSHDIEIGKVSVPEGDLVGRAVLFHWGNAGDHYGSIEKGYNHKPNWKPTAHPHDVKIGVIECTNVGRGFNHSQGEGALHIAAGYNIEVGELIVNGGNTAFTVTGGDLGFDYATAEEKAHGMKNIKIGKITATKLNYYGMQILGYALIDTSINVNTEVTVGEAVLEASTKGTNGILLHSVDSLNITSLTLRKFNKEAIYIGKNNKSLKLDTVSVESCKHSVMTVNRYATNAPRSEKIEIGALHVKQSGLMTAGLISLHQFGELHIGAMTTDRAICKYALSVEKNHSFGSVRIDSMDLSGVVNMTGMQMEAVLYAVTAVPAASTVSVGTLTDPASAPLTAGASCAVKVGN